MKKDYINVSCPVVLDGKHYSGFTLHPGVNVSSRPAACLPGLTQVYFENCAPWTKDSKGNQIGGPIVEGISGTSIDHKPNRGLLGLGRLFGGYLQIKL